MLAALGRRAGVGVIGAVKQAVVIRYRDHGAGASAVCIIRARLAQAVGTLVGFIKSAYLFHGLHLTGAAQRARGGAGAPRPSARLPLALSLYLAGHSPLRFVGRLAGDL